MQMLKLFGSIAKVEEQDDGTIKVYGAASSGSRDAAGEIVLPDAMKSALPDYSLFPALREMHQPLAAGKVLEAAVDDDGTTNIIAHVVDPIAVTKVKTGVYAGFSIGGKVTKRDANDRTIITGLRLVEISLVDSPCNPDATLTMWKADNMATEFKPAAADVIARAKLLAKAAGTARFKDFLFEAGQELSSEHLLEKGDVLDVEPSPPAPTAAVDEPPAADEPGKTAAAVVEIPASADAVVEGEAPAGEQQAAPEAGAEGGEGTVEAAAGADPVTGEAAEEDHAGEGAAENDEPGAKEAADPAAAITAAIEKGNAAADAAAPAPDGEAPTADVLFADFTKAAAALKGITSESPLAKSMWHVERLADLMGSFACLQSCVASEAQYEGDGSQIPAQLAEQLRAMGATLIAMAQEEVAEVVASLTGGEMVEIIYCGDEICLAEQIVDLVKADADLMEKAGARNSKTDAKHIQAAHDSLVKLGCACSADNVAKVEGAPDAAETAEQITTLTAENEGLKKSLGDAAAGVEAMVEKFTGTIETLQSEVGDLRKRFDDEPLPPKTAGPAAVAKVVAKSTDTTGGGGDGGEGTGMTDEQFQKAWGELPEAERGQILLKIALNRPTLIGPPAR